MKTDKILVVADDGPSSIKAIEYGFNLARDLGAKVMLLSIIEPALAIGNPDAGVFPDDALIAVKKKTEEFLSLLKNKYGTAVETELMSRVGDIMPLVIDTAAKWEAGLIIAGTHGRTGLSKLLNGSIAESIVSHSSVPVCIVPMDR